MDSADGREAHAGILVVEALQDGDREELVLAAGAEALVLLDLGVVAEQRAGLRPDLRVGELEDVVDAYTKRGVTIEIGDEVGTDALLASIEKIPALKEAAVKLCAAMDLAPDDPAHVAGAAEFVLEALYVSDRLSKYLYQGKTVFKR